MKKHTFGSQPVIEPLQRTVCYPLAMSLLLMTMTASAVWAQYKPPKGNPPRGPLVSNGSRDRCGEQYEIPLTVLAPTQHVGRTTSTTPTLAWFVPATDPYRINLSLFTFEEDQGLKLLQQVEYVASATGVVKFSWPQNQAQLKSGQRYLWQVSLACAADSPIYDQSFVSELEIQEPTAALTAALNEAQTPLEKAEVYAEAGYWFDAMGEVLLDVDKAETVKLAKTLLKGLAKSEGGTHGQFLGQIAETLQSQASQTVSQPK